MLTSMRLGTERIRQIVLSLRNFSRMDESAFKAVDLHDGLENTLLLLQHRLGASLNQSAIQVVKDYDELPHVECAAGHLNQVFVTVLNNAIDALERDRTQPLQASEGERQPQITLRTTLLTVETSPWVKIEIVDNGPGMPEAIQKSLFEPLCTTKPVRRCTGMGMSLSYQIITEKHQGTLECVSTVGEGTTILIQIPCRRASLQAQSSPVQRKPPPQLAQAVV